MGWVGESSIEGYIVHFGQENTPYNFGMLEMTKNTVPQVGGVRIMLRRDQSTVTHYLNQLRMQ